MDYGGFDEKVDEVELQRKNTGFFGSIITSVRRYNSFLFRPAYWSEETEPGWENTWYCENNYIGTEEQIALAIRKSDRNVEKTTNMQKSQSNDFCLRKISLNLYSFFGAVQFSSYLSPF